MYIPGTRVDGKDEKNRKRCPACETLRCRQSHSDLHRAFSSTSHYLSRFRPACAARVVGASQHRFQLCQRTHCPGIPPYAQPSRKRFRCALGCIQRASYHLGLSQTNYSILGHGIWKPTGYQILPPRCAPLLFIRLDVSGAASLQVARYLPVTVDTIPYVTAHSTGALVSTRLTGVSSIATLSLSVDVLLRGICFGKFVPEEMISSSVTAGEGDGKMIGTVPAFQVG